MVTLAAGMESDMSDSECDMVFSVGDSSKAKTEKNISNSINLKTNSNGVLPNGNSVSNHHSDERFSPSGTHPRHKHHRTFMRRQCIDTKSSQVLDDLRYAVNQGNLETVKTILEKNIWVDTILKSGWTSLMYACSAGHPDIVEFLLEKKADPNYHKDMVTPLMAVCMSKKNEDDLLKCCSLLLDYGGNCNSHERHLTTPLMFAAREGYTQIVKKLLEAGAQLNSADNRGYTALSWAAACGQGQVIRQLLEKGADANLQNNMGQSPVDLAYDNGHMEVVSLLTKGHFLRKNLNTELPNVPTKSAANEIVKHSGSTRNTLKSEHFVKHGDLELFLTGIDCQDLIPIFNEQQLNFHDLLIMDDEELEKVGIQKVGVRKKILEACKSVHKKEWEHSSLPNLKQKQYISCPDAVAMMGNIAKHLKYISSSVIYIRQQIQSQPRILELSQDSANVHDLLDEMEDSLKNVRFLNDEMRFFKMHLEKVQDQVQYIPADLIVETVPANSNQGKILFTVIGITAASTIVASILWKHPSAFNSIVSLFKFKIPSIAE